MPALPPVHLLPGSVAAALDGRPPLREQRVQLPRRVLLFRVPSLNLPPLPLGRDATCCGVLALIAVSLKASTLARLPPSLCSALGLSQLLGGLLRSQLAGLFHPAATCRVFLQGFVPRCGSVPDFSGPFPLLSLGRRACGRNRASSISLDFRGFLPASSAVTSVVVETTLAPRPSWSSLSSGLCFPILAFPFGMPPPSTFVAMSPPRRVPGVLRNRE